MLGKRRLICMSDNCHSIRIVGEAVTCICVGYVFGSENQRMRFRRGFRTQMP
jgi:hypothetical protein